MILSQFIDLFSITVAFCFYGFVYCSSFKFFRCKSLFLFLFLLDFWGMGWRNFPLVCSTAWLLVDDDDLSFFLLVFEYLLLSEHEKLIW